MSHEPHGSVAARLRRVPRSAEQDVRRLAQCFDRTVAQLRHAADLGGACRNTSLLRGSAHIIAILDDLERELAVLRVAATRPT